MKRIRSSGNYTGSSELDYSSAQVKHGLAVPNRSLSVRQIISMHHSALPPIQMMPVYPPTDVPNLNAMDIAEVRAYRASVDSHIVDLRQSITDRRAETANSISAAALAKRKATVMAAKSALTLKSAAEAGIDVNTLKPE